MNVLIAGDDLHSEACNRYDVGHARNTQRYTTFGHEAFIFQLITELYCDMFDASTRTALELKIPL